MSMLLLIRFRVVFMLHSACRFLEKRRKRVWARKVKYDVRKSFADSRLRVKGRFVKKEDEELLRDLMQMV